MVATGMALLAYVALFSVAKFRRIKKEKIEYKKIKRAVKEISPEEAALRLAAQNAEKDFLAGKAGGQPLNNQLANIGQIRPTSGLALTPTNAARRPLRSSQSFVERRDTAFKVV